MENLRHVLINTGESVYAIGLLSGISHKTIYNYLKGSKPNVTKLAKLVDWLNSEWVLKKLRRTEPFAITDFMPEKPEKESK